MKFILLKCVNFGKLHLYKGLYVSFLKYICAKLAIMYFKKFNLVKLNLIKKRTKCL